MIFKKKQSAWDKVSLARLMERPRAQYYIDNIFTNFVELHGDRCYGDDKAIIGGIAEINNVKVTVIGIARGSSTKENINRKFGMVSPEGYKKSLRLMKQAEKFNRPIITIVDTPGAFCGVEAEERGQGYVIAQNLFEMANLKTPIIAILTGEGGSGGALGLAVADKVFIMENAVYSVLSPEGFSSILWKDPSRVKEAADVMKMTAENLLEFKIVDGIVPEPQGGAQNNPEQCAEAIKSTIIESLDVLMKQDVDTLLCNRYNKFRNMK